jgi:hypothetical protein
MNPMSPTFAPASPAIIAALVGWLMVRVGEGKRMSLGLELLDVHSNASGPPEIDTRRWRDTSPDPKET